MVCRQLYAVNFGRTSIGVFILDFQETCPVFLNPISEGARSGLLQPCLRKSTQKSKSRWPMITTITTITLYSVPCTAKQSHYAGLQCRYPTFELKFCKTFHFHSSFLSLTSCDVSFQMLTWNVKLHWLQLHCGYSAAIPLSRPAVEMCNGEVKILRGSSLPLWQSSLMPCIAPNGNWARAQLSK